MIRKGRLKPRRLAFIATLLFLSPKLAGAQTQPVSNAQILEAITKLDTKVEKLDSKVDALSARVETLYVEVATLRTEFRTEVKRLDQRIDDLSGKINYLFALFIAMLALFGTGVGFLVNISRKLGPMETAGIVGDEKKKIAEIELRLQRLEEALRSTKG